LESVEDYFIMFVSIIICTYSLDNFQNLTDAVDSLLNQTHKEIEIIIVVDGNQELYKKVVKVYDNHEKIKVEMIRENIGLSGARNTGVNSAQGHAIAFFDDDAVADNRWVENLVNIYKEHDAIAVGGKILPLWFPKKPDYFPDELGWLVGMTHEGFAGDKVTEVRNTFGSNMSSKRQVFANIGLFNERYGASSRRTSNIQGGEARKRASYIQGEEAEFSLRMKNKLKKGIIYNPEAIVYHKIPSSRVKPKILLRRAFYQGYSKALLRRLNPSSQALSTEQSYLMDLLFKYIPSRIKKVLSASNFIKELKQISFLAAAIISVGLGFSYGYVKRRDRHDSD